MSMSKGAFAVSSLLTVGLAGHGLPALTAIGPVRKVFLKRLSGISQSQGIALTFDDGPDRKSTPLFLDKLDELGWKATFFMLGNMVEKNPATAQEVVSRGHEVAIHGYAHRNFLVRSPKATKEDLTRAKRIISEVTGTKPRFFRPPYGVLNSQALITAKHLGLEPVLWTQWGRDWRAKATPTSVSSELAKNLKPGSTLLLHDSDCTSAPESYRSALGALDIMAEVLSARNIPIERLSDHF